MEEPNAVLNQKRKEDLPENDEQSTSSSKENSVVPGEETKPVKNSQLPAKEQKPKAQEKRVAPIRAIAPKGLPNLGNTCFFNSAIQCLLSTHQLKFYLEKAAHPFTVSIPECTVTVYDKEIHLESADIEVKFEKSTTFINVFKNFITEFYTERSPNPRPVFEQVSRRAPRFRGWHQQDSHELLRYLIDGLRQEEVDAIGQAVKNHLEQRNVTEDVVKVKRAHMNFAKPVLDCIFGGSLLQVICCDECHYNSVCFEPFLDLSLSIPRLSTNAQPAKADKFMSKSQLKKAKKKNKKNKKKNKGRGQQGNQDPHTRSSSNSISEETAKVDENTSADCNGTEKPDDDEAPVSDPIEENDDADETQKANDSDSSIDAEAVDSSASLVFAQPLGLSVIPEGKTVEYALSRFTSFEQLRGSNSYECEKCCEPTNKKEGKRIKTVYAQKKYLLYTLPPVLTLQLKRFEKTQSFGRTYASKVNDHVTFPLILDVAPYCSKASKQIAKGQTKILYSLYGIVSHSGSLSGGHYVAYVKSRKPIEHIKKFFKQASMFDASSIGDFLEFTKTINKLQASEIEGGMSAEEAQAALTPSTWYYCSDSHVAPTTESRILSAEAYLLFYERFY